MHTNFAPCLGLIQPTRPITLESIMIKEKKIFITGGAGFIGSNLIGKLVEHNKITVLDNLERNSLKNRAFANHPNLNLIIGDILDIKKIKESLPKETGSLIHCGAISGIDPVLKN